MEGLLNFINDNPMTITVAWLVFEQILAATSLKSNSTFQLICNIIDAVLNRVKTIKKEEPVPEPAVENTQNNA